MADIVNYGMRFEDNALYLSLIVVWGWALSGFMDRLAGRGFSFYRACRTAFWPAAAFALLHLENSAGRPVHPPLDELANWARFIIPAAFIHPAVALASSFIDRRVGRPLFHEMAAGSLVLCLISPSGMTAGPALILGVFLFRWVVPFGLGRAALYRSRLALASRMFRFALRMRPGARERARTLLRMATVWRRQGSLSLAIPLLHRLLASDLWRGDRETGAAIALEYARCLAESGAVRRAGEVLNRLETARGAAGDFQAERMALFAFIALQEGKGELAKLHLEEAVALARSRAARGRIFLLRAQAMTALGDRAEALNALARMESVLGASDSPWGEALGRAVGAGRREGDASSLSAALEQTLGREEAAERAFAHFLDARSRDRAGDGEKCVEECREVDRLFEESWFAAEARALMRRWGAATGMGKEKGNEGSGT